MEYESNHFCNEKSRAASLSPGKGPSQPGKDVAALLKRISIHPEAVRILGHSSVAVVSLERLNFQKMFLSSCLQPMVSLVRLPCQTQAKIHNGAADLDHPRQANGLSQKETSTREERRRAASLQSTPAESPELNPTDSELTSWTEPYCPESASFDEPEQDSGFDCDSNPDQTYILCDSESDEWDPDGRQDSETFYLDPDPEQTLVIELDPELDVDQDRPTELEGESETMCEMDTVQMDENDDHRSDLCCSEMEVQVQVQQPEPGPGAEEMESEDFCAVCLNGGDLLCCDRCPKVYHVDCHIPPIAGLPLGDWVCTLCRTDQDSYDCENMSSCGGVKAPYTLSNQDQRSCEKLTLLLYCHTLSAPFHEAVSPLARNYYQIIKRPINLSVIRRKLDKSNTLHYFTAEQFVDDVLLMFKNCATFNYPDSEVAQAGRNLEMFFLSKLREFFPEHTFPSASQDTTDRARLRWLSRKRKEDYRKKKKYVFRGKKYYL